MFRSRDELLQSGGKTTQTRRASASLLHLALPLLMALLSAVPGVRGGGCWPITFNDTLYMANCGQAIVFAPSDGVPRSFILYYGWKREVTHLGGSLPRSVDVPKLYTC